MLRQHTGVTFNQDYSDDGCMLFAPAAGDKAYLISYSGKLVHSWSVGKDFTNWAYLLPNGNLFMNECSDQPQGVKLTGSGLMREYDKHAKLVLITPSGIPYETLKPEHIASMSVADTAYEWDGPCIPSSEWHFHREILESNKDFGAVIHTHSMYATILSIGRRAITPCHYMIAAFGGSTVRCADYATHGTPELSSAILKAMKNRSACLMANHGMVVAGPNLENGKWAAVELETLAKQYYHADLADAVSLLDEEEIKTVLKAFCNYGPKNN